MDQSTSAVGGAGGGNFGFHLMQSVEALKVRAGTPITTAELHSIVGFNHKTATQFLNKLKDQPQVSFDKVSKTWTFLPLYAHLTSVQKILEEIALPEYKHSGFQLTNEILDAVGMPQLVNEILNNKLVRVIRTGKVPKCKMFPPESGFQCDILDMNKCEPCANLVGLSLYALDSPHVESSKDLLASDLVELWLETKMPKYNDFLNEVKLQETTSLELR